MAFYVTMSAFIAANFVLIGFEMRKRQADATQPLAFAPVKRTTNRT